MAKNGLGEVFNMWKVELRVIAEFVQLKDSSETTSGNRFDVMSSYQFRHR